jgi:signal transduction histidine kinase
MSAPLDPEQLRDAYEERVRRLTESVETRERWLAILSAIAVQTHGLESVEEILAVALDEILGRFGLKAAWVFMGRLQDRKLQFAAAKGVSKAYLDTVAREGLEDCLCPEVFWSGHRMEARNTTQCPRMPTIVEGLAEPVAHACIPLRFEGESRGVLNVAARPGQRFTDDELRFLETLGHQLCVAIERASHLKAERQRNLEGRAMAAINKAIGERLESTDVLAAVGRSAAEVLEADRVQVFLGSDSRHLVVARLSGLSHPELREGQAIDFALVGARAHAQAIDARTVLQVNDFQRDPRVNNDLATRWGIAAAILLPLVARDRTLGLMVVTRQYPRPWAAEQVDVAEALAAQASIAIENARLYAEARKSFQDLTDAQANLVQNQKMALLGTFASGLAHEVRNPLNSMGLQLSILERRVRRLGDSLSAELLDHAALIRGEIQRLENLVADFLLFSRTNRFQHAEGSLDDLVDEVVRLLEPEARTAGVTLRRERAGSGAIPPLPIDADKMKQVAINLVRNAVEAMPQGGEVRVVTDLAGDKARLVVSDDGPGLPPGLDVFQLFVTTKAKGTGLGLSIAQQIVSDHGGRITAESSERGAVFEVTLPLAAEGGGRRA